MDSLIWYTGIFRIKSGILESSQESRNPAKIPKDSESCRRKFVVSDPSNLYYLAILGLSIHIFIKHTYSRSRSAFLSLKL